MNRSQLPAAQLGAFLLKGLYLDACKRLGQEEADRILGDAWLNASDLEDETQPIPLRSYAAALKGLLGGRDPSAILELDPLSPGLLAYWVPLLRAADHVQQAFDHLPWMEAPAEDRPLRVEHVVRGHGFWEATLVPTYEEPSDDAGLYACYAAEFAAVPRLFGYASTVRTLEAGRIRLQWGEDPRARPVWGVGVISLIASAVLAWRVEVGWWLGLGVLPPALVAGWNYAQRGVVRERERQARGIRAAAFERSLTLKERERETGDGAIEGSVVANRYRIENRIASGATGVIYRATRIEDGRRVAVKLLRASAVHDHAAADRLRREAEALGLAWHPNVVEILDDGRLPDGTLYLVMELLEGESLEVFLKKHGPMLPPEVGAIATQVCDALVAIHAAGIVHRDLKPANILLVGAGKVKLVDFGIARVEWEEMRITQMGVPLGTPGYMSPEQQKGGEIDARSDVYSLGALLFECLVGEPPPPAPSGTWSPDAPADADPKVEEGLSGLSEGWQALIRKALSPERDDRFESAKEMLKELRRLQGAPLELNEAAPIDRTAG